MSDNIEPKNSGVNDNVHTVNNLLTSHDEQPKSPLNTPQDNITLGSTISQIVGALSPSNATTSPTKTNAVVTTNKNSDMLTPKISEVPDEKDNKVENESTFHPSPISSIQSQPGVKFLQNDELEASFTGISTKNTDPISMVLPDPDSSQAPVLNDNKLSVSTSSTIGNIGITLGLFNKEKKDSEINPSISTANKNAIVKSSPLLSSTPPTVSKSLIKAYPFLILILKGLNVLTWNDDTNHLPIFLVLLSTFAILYYEPLIIYLGHLLPVFALWIYSESKSYVKTYQAEHSTLDDIIQTISLISNRADILISPIVELGLTAGDLKRLLFTTVFLSPVYVVTSFFFLPPNKMILSLSILVLTYHSKWSKITRSLLWKSRSFRLLCFYLTGLDFENSGLSKASSLFNLNKRLSKRFGKNNSGNSDSLDGNLNSKSSVRFTYVIYENQRRWLGVGWTPNLLSYERTPWTDDFLNESESIDSFELPQLPLSIDIQDIEKNDNDTTVGGNNSNDDGIINTKGMVWRWIDKTWRLDLTNDGSIQLPSTKPRTTANPRTEDGWIYYDNTWKNPSTEDGFSKYTRRRRWIRTAELVYINRDGKDIPIRNHAINNANNNTSPKSVKITETVKLSDEKGVRFEGLEVSPGNSNENADKSSGKLENKAPKSGLKRGDSGEIKKRKSIRFEDTKDE
jgi:hypothetical protein